MELLQRTNDRFREGVPVRVVRVESLTTMWVRLAGCPKITQTLNLEMMEHPMEYLPKAKSLRAGMLVAVLADFKDASAWERAILLQRTMTGYIVFLIDWGLESEQCLDSIRLLPRNLAKMAPWARKNRPARCTRATETREETSSGPMYHVEANGESNQHRSFSRRSNNGKVAAGSRAG